MSLNLGDIKATFTLAGLKQAIDQLREANNAIGAMATKLEKNTGAQNAFMTKLRNGLPVYQDLVKGARNLGEVSARTNKELQTTVVKLEQLKMLYKAGMKVNPYGPKNAIIQGQQDVLRKKDGTPKLDRKGNVTQLTKEWKAASGAVLAYNKYEYYGWQQNVEHMRNRFAAWNRELAARKLILVNEARLQAADRVRTAQAIRNSNSRFAAFSKEADARAKEAVRQAASLAVQQKAERLRAVQEQRDARLRATANGSGFQSFSRNASNRGAVAAGDELFATQQRSLQSGWGRFVADLKNPAAAWGRFQKQLADGTSINKAKEGIGRLSTGVHGLTNNIKTNHQWTNNWMDRFGRVAIGFWIAYRAINAVEMAIGNVSRTFAGGAKFADEYQNSVATTAGMLALLSDGMGGFEQRFTALKSIMAGTMQEMIRLAPAYGVTMDEIGSGLKELAQFGVVVKPEDAAKTLNTFALIREIATTVGSSTKQVRQEIQSLFNGSARISDQFMLMIKKAIPDLYATLKKIREEGGSTTEMWSKLTDRMFDFKDAIVEALTTIQGQYGVAKNSLSVISMMAIRASGIYQGWVDTLKNFNKQLFQADGTLAPLGVKFYNAFYRTWQLIRNVVGLFADLAKKAYTFFASFSSGEGQAKSLAVALFKVATATMLIRTALMATFWIMAKLIVLSGAWTIIKTIGALGRGVATIVTAGYSLAKAWPLAAAALSKGALAIIAVGTAALGAGGSLLYMKKLTQAIAYGMDLDEAADHAAGSVKRSFAAIGKSLDFTQYFTDPVKELGDYFAKVFKFEDIKGLSPEEIKKSMMEFFGTFSFDGSDGKGADKLGTKIDSIRDKMRGLYDDLAKQNMSEVAKEVYEQFVKMSDLGDELNEALKLGLPKEQFEEWTALLNKFGQSVVDNIEKMKLDKVKDTFEQFNADMLSEGIEAFDKALIDSQKDLDKFMVVVRELWVVGSPKRNEFEIWAKKYSAFLLARRDREAEILEISKKEVLLQTKLAALEFKKEFFQIGNKAALKEELLIQQQQLALAYERYEIERRLNPTSKDTADLAAQIAEQESAIARIGERLKQLKNPLNGFKFGLLKFTAELPEYFDIWVSIANDTASAMKDSFSDFFFDALEGEMDSFTDYWKAFAQSLNRILADAMANTAMNLLTGGNANNVFANGAGGLMGTFSGVGGSILDFGASLFNGGFGLAGNPMKGSAPVPGDALAGFDYSYANGGWITEPVFGVGQDSGKTYQIAENHPEYVNPGGAGGHSISVPVNINGPASEAYASGLRQEIEHTVAKYVRRHS